MGRSGLNAQCTENVLVEHVVASGLGLTVGPPHHCATAASPLRHRRLTSECYLPYLAGAVRPHPNHSCVRNVTFRYATMHHTFKGIYVKSQYSDDPTASGEITNLRYEHLLMESPTQVSDTRGYCC